MNKIQLVMGIDVGGTNTAFGFVDRKGKLIYDASLPTKADLDARQLFERIFKAADKSFKKFEKNYELVGIGIGAPNANYYKGTVEMPPNLNWGNVNVVKLIKEFSDLPVVITNDANAAALGEMIFGAAKGMKNFVVITLGTGLGSGIVVDGKLVYGNDGFAGELGHTTYDPNGRLCGCGRLGCLETYASATGIKRTLLELMAKYPYPSTLRKLNCEKLSAKDIYNAALKGDKLALEAFDFTAKVLGFKLVDTVVHLSPEAIILYGGLALAGDLLIKPTKKYMEKHMLNIFKNKVKIIPSALPGKGAGIMGAAALIWNEMEK
ncbi:ROK family protein [Melioribacter sp. OK-6-Me]|uniref:ROK family protein n=1 Tax=unclassified Melioribacter TaxID=2627329 RepID=UPI003EDAB5BA